MDADITFLFGPEVNLVKWMGDDLSVVRAARVSTVGENDPREDDEKANAGLINYLMKHRHGTPFEAGVMQVFVKAPIFVFREFQRHRIASYSEMSARYKELPGEFYLPPNDRPLVNVGSSARPQMAPASTEVFDATIGALIRSYEAAWASYQALLGFGIAREIARAVLPVGCYSQMYATMNLRSLMNFLSLRVDSPDAAVKTHPQWEIQKVAELIEVIFQERFPLVHEAFIQNGRVAP